MAAVVVGSGYAIPGRAAPLIQVLTGVVAWFALLRLTGALHKEDGERILHLGRALPAPMRPAFQYLTGLLVPAR